MTQAAGSAAQVLIVKESVFGVTPVTPSYKLLTNAAYGESANSEAAEIISQAISKNRSVQATRNGQKTSAGSFPFEFSTDGTELILEGLAGAKTGLGTSVSPYIFKRNATLPSFSLEKGFTDVMQFFTLKGMVVNSLELNVTPGEIVSGTVSFIGKGDPSVDTTSADASPDSVVHVPFTGIDAQVFVDGSEVYSPSFTMNITNGATVQNVIGSAFAHSINAGRGECTGTISILFEDADLFNDWLAEAESDIELRLTIGAKITRFKFPKTKYNGSGLPNIETPEGVVYTLNWRGIYDSTALSDFVVEVENS